MKQDELSNQLKNQDLGTVSPAAFLQVGAPVFPDDTTTTPLHAFQEIVGAYQAVHMPAFGNPIAQTGGVVSVDGAENLIVPEKAEIYHVQYISLTNGGGAAPVIASVTLGGMALGFDSGASYSTAVTIPPSTTFSFPVSIDADLNLPLVVSVSSGTASDLTTKAAYIKRSQ